ncbi:hypothetical protein IVB69_13635 [Flavobacterium sp. J49]|uniref:hypothetical protein n=1 Tax=Flavobacterium sp. J49 TaxID=2718534 RepID=UPI0015946380|nr:hypothetical protein [Flavobacterium sp. J49]MBF6642528.1 hypothetical protein [Flavobacterium sp. J49]NIC03774.1 hypothetical protein [Flavobacterium sp. J49]
MRKAVEILLFLLVVLVFDRFLFLPGRMNGTWEYQTGTNIGDSISFENIDIVNNFEVKISTSRKLDSFYLLGCYFGTLYLLDKDTMEYTVYEKYKPLGIE